MTPRQKYLAPVILCGDGVWVVWVVSRRVMVPVCGRCRELPGTLFFVFEGDNHGESAGGIGRGSCRQVAGKRVSLARTALTCWFVGWPTGLATARYVLKAYNYSDN